MWRYLVGLAAGVLLVAGGVLWWRNNAVASHSVLPAAPIETAVATNDAQASDDTPDPPQASEKTREEKRFSRADHDKDGKISRDEYLAARKRNFAKLDVNGDGKLSFDEYAFKAEEKFATADHDKSGALNATEFATTKAVRKAKAAPRCPPASRSDADEG